MNIFPRRTVVRVYYMLAGQNYFFVGLVLYGVQIVRKLVEKLLEKLLYFSFIDIFSEIINCNTKQVCFLTI